MTNLSRWTDHAYAALRVVTGLAFAVHGAQKLFGVLGGMRPPLFSQIGLGGVIEFFGGLLIAAGLLTRPAAFLCSGTMAVAYTQFHWKLAFGAGFFPSVNGGELALVYSFLFLYYACRGSGRFAVRPD
ncbi:MAG: DoxX family protein [Elusimicrobiota bacterium]|nr:DoxX family protein [Elusimicrobiota bacterium]